jgi:hypothetical protein
MQDCKCTKHYLFRMEYILVHDTRDSILVFLDRFMNTLKRRDFVRDAGIAVGFLVIGAFSSPLIQEWYDENFGKTPERLAGLLRGDKIREFNELRNQINLRIEFDGIDLSRKNLKGVDLASVILTNVDLSHADLENANLLNLQASGDLSDSE